MTSPPRNHKKKPTYPSMFSMVFGYKWYVALLIIFTVLANGIALLTPKLIAKGIDSYTSGTFAPRKIFVEFALVAIFVFIFTYVQNIIQILASERVARDLRKKLSEKISSQTFAFVEKHTPATLLTNLTSDVDAVKSFVAQAMGMLIASICIIIGASILLIMTDRQLAMVVLLIIPLIMGSFFLVMRRVRKLFLKTQKVIDWLNKVINESILGSSLIRVLNSQEDEKKKFLEANSAARNLGLTILGYFSLLIPIITFIANLAGLTILWMGGHFVIIGTMSLGDLSAFNSYLSILIFPIIMIGFLTGIITRSSASYGRIAEVLYAPETQTEGTKNIDIKGLIKMSQVALKFGERAILKDISLTITPGSRTAIVGPTAAGKTQLLYLLTGLVQPTSGEITYENIPLSEIDKESFHTQSSIVFQDSIVFNMSIRENIAFSEEVSTESMERALQTAELSDYISSLPKGLDTVVSERGTSLSGGQKQRVMLARALALNPKVLFLDDFTARVDTTTEQKILQNMRGNYPDLTLISVTQKIDSIVGYDQVILLMEGEIIAQGTHKHLLQTSPEYAQLYESQHSTTNYEVHT